MRPGEIYKVKSNNDPYAIKRFKLIEYQNNDEWKVLILNNNNSPDYIPFYKTIPGNTIFKLYELEA